MTGGISGCTQVEEYEDGEDSRVSCHWVVIGEFEMPCFSAVELVGTKLEPFIQVIVGLVRMENGVVLKILEMKVEASVPRLFYLKLKIITEHLKNVGILPVLREE